MGIANESQGGLGAESLEREADAICRAVLRLERLEHELTQLRHSLERTTRDPAREPAQASRRDT